MKYWFMINDRRVGPVSIEEAENLDITPTTPAWHEGMPDWVSAMNLPELAMMIERKEAYLRQQQQQAMAYSPLNGNSNPNLEGTPEKCPPTYLGWSIAATILCCLPVGILGIIFSSKVSTAWANGEFDKAYKMSERAQWCIIIAIILGLLSIPLNILMMSI